MQWIPVAAWVAAAVLAAVVLGFCCYEVFWKLRRLRGDLSTLQRNGDALAVLAGQLSQAAAQRGRSDADDGTRTAAGR